MKNTFNGDQERKALDWCIKELGIIKVLLLQGDLRGALDELSDYDVSYWDGEPFLVLDSMF